MRRVMALLTKELLDLRQNPAVFLPAVLTGLASTALPFVIAVVIPIATGERLSDSSDFQVALEMYRVEPASRSLTPEGAAQAWIFQQFLLLLTITPIAGAMSIAAAAVITAAAAIDMAPAIGVMVSSSRNC